MRETEGMRAAPAVGVARRSISDIPVSHPRVRGGSIWFGGPEMKWSTIVLLIAGSSTLFATDVLSLDSKRDSLIFAGYTFEKV